MIKVFPPCSFLRMLLIVERAQPMTTLTLVKTSEAAKMLVLRRVAKHHERMAYIARLEGENIELRRALAEARERLSQKS